MEMLREWIITILSVMIFITFIEILIPNSGNKKYINVVVGFLIMVVILSPVIKLLNSGLNLSENILQASNELDQMTTHNRIQNVEMEQKKVIIDLYKEELKIQMKDRIENLSDHGVEEIYLEIDEKEGETFGFIHKIQVVMKKEKAPTIEKYSSKPVEINVSIKSKKNNTVEASSIWLNNEEENLKKDLSYFYKVEKENIHINILE